MTTALYAPLPLPLDRLRPGVGLLVVALHVGLLWVANLYWPLQSVLLGAVQNAAQSITVQILQKTTPRSTPADNAALNANSPAISNPGRQRFGRSEALLELPATLTEASTPLAATQQAAPPTSVVAAAPTPQIQPKADLEPPVKPMPQATAVPERAQPAAVATPQDKLPEITPTQPPSVAPASTTPLATPPTTPAPPALPAASPQPAIATAQPAPPAANPPSSPISPASPTSPPDSAAATSSASTAGNTTTAPASGAAQASGTGSAAASTGSNAAPALPPAGAGAPLNLNLPPRYIYRPPVFVPRRSLSEMANDQLRRKPRDPFADGIEGAGNIDCLKDTPEGPAQGLLAIGPLLKRAIEEKCRK